MATMDSISDIKARTEELKAVMQDQRAKKNEYAATISQQLLGNVFPSYQLACTIFMHYNTL